MGWGRGVGSNAKTPSGQCKASNTVSRNGVGSFALAGWGFRVRSYASTPTHRGPVSTDRLDRYPPGRGVPGRRLAGDQIRLSAWSDSPGADGEQAAFAAQTRHARSAVDLANPRGSHDR